MLRYYGVARLRPIVDPASGVRLGQLISYRLYFSQKGARKAPCWKEPPEPQIGSVLMRRPIGACRGLDVSESCKNL